MNTKTICYSAIGMVLLCAFCWELRRVVANDADQGDQQPGPKAAPSGSARLPEDRPISSNGKRNDPLLGLQRVDARTLEDILEEKKTQPSFTEFFDPRSRQCDKDGLVKHLMSCGYSESRAAALADLFDQYVRGGFDDLPKPPAMLMEVLNQFRETLCLPSLGSLSLESAEAIGSSQLRFVYLPGLESLDNDAAGALVKGAGSKKNLFLSGLSSLTAETARILVSGRAPILSLGGVETLEPDLAQALADGNLESLILPGLRKMSPESAAQLGSGGYSYLTLPGLRFLDPETAQNLVAGGNIDSLILSGLKDLDPQTAGMLVQGNVSTVKLTGMTELMPDVAKVLANSRMSFDLSGVVCASPESINTIVGSSSYFIFKDPAVVEAYQRAAEALEAAKALEVFKELEALKESENAKGLEADVLRDLWERVQAPVRGGRGQTAPTSRERSDQ